jgi:hypothetical protein
VLANALLGSVPLVSAVVTLLALISFWPTPFPLAELRQCEPARENANGEDR